MQIRVLLILTLLFSVVKAESTFEIFPGDFLTIMWESDVSTVFLSGQTLESASFTTKLGIRSVLTAVEEQFIFVGRTGDSTFQIQRRRASTDLEDFDISHTSETYERRIDSESRVKIGWMKAYARLVGDTLILRGTLFPEEELSAKPLLVRSDRAVGVSRKGHPASKTNEQSPGASPSTPGALTYAKYLQVKDGMSYREVVQVIETEGEEVSRNRIAGVPGVMEPVETVMYQWVSKAGGMMNAMFQNDKMISKAQFGLK